MVKMKNLKMYDIRDVPDHILQEMHNMAQKLLAAIAPVVRGADSNITMAAVGFLYAAVIDRLVDDDPEHKRKAYRNAAIAIMKNGSMISRVDIMEEHKD